MDGATARLIVILDCGVGVCRFCNCSRGFEGAIVLLPEP